MQKGVLQQCHNHVWFPKGSFSDQFFIPLFFQKGPIQIKRNAFFQGVQAKMAVLKFHIKFHMNI